VSNGQSLHLELLFPQILNHQNLSTEIFCQRFIREDRNILHAIHYIMFMCLCIYWNMYFNFIVNRCAKG